ncbi:MAG: hypothetical protein JXA93_04675 [Anaerolineae bacterium]|nr:hypothetical protein [Anaerolineae bacterium]
MVEMTRPDSSLEWLRRWRLARAATAAAAGWILTLPILARLMRWREQTVTWVQNILGPISGLVWGRIGWIGVRRHGFSNEDAFLAGGLAGMLAPTLELTLRRMGWPPISEEAPGVGEVRPPLIAYPFAWLWGFLIGGVVAAVGAALARLRRD